MKRAAICSRTPALAGVFVCALLWLTGCATPPQWQRLGADWPADVPPRVELRQVPFHPQDDYECGPASLAMAAGAAGLPLTPAQLVEQVYLPGRQGSLQQEMLAATRRQGLLAFPLDGRLESVLRELTAGHPVIVFQNLSLPLYPVWHYAVMIGFDRGQETVLLHSGRTERLEMSIATFERTWARGTHWAMVALRPTELPASVTPDRHAAAVAALERVRPAAAMAAYARGLQSWPDHRSSLLGLGNAAYAQGLLTQAAASYREAVRRHPDFADAWNNLAQVLFEQGQREEARRAIEQALVLGGSRRQRYLELHEKIMRAGAGQR